MPNITVQKTFFIDEEEFRELQKNLDKLLEKVIKNDLIRDDLANQFTRLVYRKVLLLEGR